ncbi:MAG: hypothetical protein AAGA03_16600 [Planctomycetota bacterium]
MKSLPMNRTFRGLAERVIWFESSSEALGDPIRLVAYAMTYASLRTCN